MGDVVEPITADELREFAEARPFGVAADPVFKERLREALWNRVRLAAERAGRAPAPADPVPGTAAIGSDPHGSDG